MFDPTTIDAWDAGDPIRALYKRAIDKSMGGKPDNVCKQMRYYVMAQLAAHSLRYAGSSVVEFGCWRGHSTLMIASIMERARKDGAGGDFHVFDSFDGLSPFCTHDMSASRKRDDYDRTKYKTSVEKFRAMLSTLDFDHVHKGWIPAVFDNVDIADVSFANIDVNLYEPTRDSLAFVYPRMVNGGVIFFDDYGYKTCPGATKAIDEYLLDETPALVVRLPSALPSW